MPDSPVRTHTRRLLCCEAVTAGPAAALTRHDAYRRKLRHELGTDPGAGLRAVHQETRPAHVISRDAQQRVVHFVPLAGVTAHDDAEREVASAIGVGEARRAAAGHLAGPAAMAAGTAGAFGPGPARSCRAVRLRRPGIAGIARLTGDGAATHSA
ncbi:BTAD domain-containing putative transcriptional regulator [Streptomyces sp. NPDC002346]